MTAVLSLSLTAFAAESDPANTFGPDDKNGKAFTAQQYTAAGQETPLTIDITQAAWNAAFAGSYSDTVTFTVSYVNTSAS